MTKPVLYVCVAVHHTFPTKGYVIWEEEEIKSPAEGVVDGVWHLSQAPKARYRITAGNGIGTVQDRRARQ